MSTPPADLYHISRDTTAPVLVEYVRWILEEARKQEISTLYFLSRDGFVLREIACLICEHEHIPLDCRYLYCSRFSLRMPTYHLIGEEAADLLFLGGYHVTLRSLMERAAIPEEARGQILDELALSESLDAELSKQELSRTAERLWQNETFSALLRRNSLSTYPDAVAYFQQEGLLDQETIAIVDSGWTGSMQRSLRQLLQSAGFRGKLVGFYFGMYAEPSDPEDGTFLTWYFSKRTGKRNKILFCNNVFECMLSAPHGMTLGYQRDNQGRYGPVFAENHGDEQLERIHEQLSGIRRGAEACLDKKGAFTTERKQVCRALRRLMSRPSPAEVSALGSFAFCDDVSESYRYSLADREQLQLLKSTTVPARILCKWSKEQSASRQLFWPYGTIALIDSPLRRAWYRLNIYVWEWLRYTLK